jgi:WD40 repeat protein
MTPQLKIIAIATIIASLIVTGCRRLTDAHDQVALLCGEDADRGGANLRIAGEGGEALPAAGLAAVLVAPTGASSLPVSSRGCVSVPAGAEGSVAVRTAAGDQGTIVSMEAARTHPLDEPISLSRAPMQLTQQSVTPSCGDAPAVNAAIAYRLAAAQSSRLDLLRLATRIESVQPGVAPLLTPWTTLGTLGSAEPQVQLPSALPEGSYRLVVDVESAFDHAAGLAPKRSVCPFRLLRTPPVVSLGGGAESAGQGLTVPLAGVEAPQGLRQVAPGTPLTFAVKDAAPVAVFYCLMPVAEGRKLDKTCAGGFKPAGSGVFAPSSGEWALSYYGVDAAGNQSPIVTAPLAVVHQDQILRLQAELRSIAAAVASHQIVESYPALFDAFGIYSGLTLELERRAVRKDLIASMLALGPRLGEWQRFDERSDGIRRMVYSPDGATLAVLDINGELDLLDGTGIKVDSLTGIDGVWFAGDGTALWLRRDDGRVTRYQLASRVETALWPNADEVMVSGDGDTAVGRLGDSAVVATRDGLEVARRQLGGATLGAISRNGDAILLKTGAAVSLWSPSSSSATLPTLTIDAKCNITSLAVASGGQVVYVGANVATNGTNYVVVGSADDVCGTRRWRPGTSTSDLLTYTPIGASSKVSPNGLDTLLLSDDGQRLFGGAGGNNLLLAWANGATEGTCKSIGASGQGAAAVALRGNDLVATASTGGQILIFDQKLDYIPGGTRLARERIANLDVPLIALALGPKAPVVAGGDRDGRVRFWRLGGNAFASVPTVASRPLVEMRRLPDGRLRTVYLETGQLAVVRDERSTTRVELAHPETVNALAIAGDGTVVSATATALRLWDGSGTTLAEIPAPAPVKTLLCAGDLVIAAAAERLDTYRLDTYRLDTRRQGARLLPVASAPVAAVASALNKDGTRLAVLQQASAATHSPATGATGGAGRRYMVLFSLPDLTPIRSGIPFDAKGPGPFAPFSPDGSRLLTADGDEGLELTRDGALLPRIPLAAAEGDGGGVNTLLFAPDGASYLASGAVPMGEPNGKDFVRLTPDGRVAARFTGFSGPLATLSVLPAPGLIAGKGQQDRGLIAWTADGARAFQIGDDEIQVGSYAATDDGRDFATLAIDTARLTFWPVRTVEEYEQSLCADLAVYLASRSDDWAVQARAMCGAAVHD